MDSSPARNLGLDLLRVTETVAIATGRWIGLGDRDGAHNEATHAMANALMNLEINGEIVIGEETRLGEHSPLDSGQKVGTGSGLICDVVVDPIDGTDLLVGGKPGAISLIGVTPRGTMWRPPSCAVYMDKIVVDRTAAQALVPECIDAPAAWTLALVARAKGKEVRDLIVIILDRPRHKDLIDEVRAAGARIILRTEGDAEGALEAAIDEVGADILMGAGGVSEGVIAACAVKALGGGILARLAPQSDEERRAILDAGEDPDPILTCDEIITSRDIYFVATGITHNPLLMPVRYRRGLIETHSLLLRAITGTRRFVTTEHRLEFTERFSPIAFSEKS
jgi:fructose-1,6-bisphosphatase II